MTLDEALDVADEAAEPCMGVKPRVSKALGVLADEVLRKDVDADIGRKLLPLAKAVVEAWDPDDMTEELVVALWALMEFVGEDGQ